MAYNVGSERELYEDWKPLFEAAQDTEIAKGPDLELERQAMLVEQTNNSPGVSADGTYPPLVRRLDLEQLADEVSDW